MAILYIIIFLAVIVVAYLIYNNVQSKKAKLPPPPKSKKRSILDLNTGGVIQIANYGEEIENIDLEVIDRHVYDQKGWKWFELECESADKKIWVEVEDDDELYIYATVKKLSLPDLNLNEEDFNRIKKAKDGEINYNNLIFEYEDKGKATFLKSGNQENSMNFEYLEFEDSSGKWLIALERWSDQSIEAFLCQKIEPQQITIYRENQNG